MINEWGKKDEWGTDQHFLDKLIWPKIFPFNYLGHCSIEQFHNQHHTGATERREFGVKLPNGQFVGQKFDENDNLA